MKYRSANRQGNAEGLSRRRMTTEPNTESLPNVKAIDRINEESSFEATSLARESLIEQQRSDTELRRIVQWRMAHSNDQQMKR